MSTRMAIPEARRASPLREAVSARADTAIRTAGGWLAAASLLMIAVFALHGPLAPDLGEQMAKISAAPDRWRVAHWLAAASLSFYAMTGLLVLSAGSRLTISGATRSAWAVVSIGALWTLTTALAEATAVTAAAIEGRREAFEAWWAFAEGKATGFAFLALAVAVIAWHESRSSDPATPRWAASVGAVAGVASFAGWALGMWLNVAAGSLLWVVASMVMSAWTLWFGLRIPNSFVRDATP
ncbi:MAG TPA: hypothetical protein VMM18_15155 [Gemmatimonadaceae bacterium]|nr:hypothetical protein [Gemmatimonadaceae bacterium]